MGYQYSQYSRFRFLIIRLLGIYGKDRRYIRLRLIHVLNELIYISHYTRSLTNETYWLDIGNRNNLIVALRMLMSIMRKFINQAILLGISNQLPSVTLNSYLRMIDPSRNMFSNKITSRWSNTTSKLLGLVSYGHCFPLYQSLCEPFCME